MKNANKFNKKKDTPRSQEVDAQKTRCAKGGKRGYSKKDTAPVGSSNASLSPLNDISWYSRNPELLAAAARIPFPYKPGMEVPVGQVLYRNNGNSKATNVSYVVPGVAKLKFQYSIGYSDGVTSPASIAAKEMYSKIRSKFSGALDEDPPDVLMYCLALDMIHAYIAYLKRIYRILNAYTPENRNLPEALLKAMSFEDADINYMQQHKTEMWGMINTLVHMVNKFNVPDNMDIYKRHRWMNENVYLDEPMLMAQMYFFEPGGFWKVDDTGANGTALRYTELDLSGHGASTLTKFYEFGTGLISALSNWDDAYTINGHIERAFEGTPFYKAELLNQDEVLAPAYVAEVLTQIENFTGVGPVSELDVVQDPATNAVLHTPKASSQNWSGNMLLNLHTTNPTAADTVIASRLMAHVTPVKTSMPLPTYRVFGGTEIPIGVMFYKYSPKTGVTHASDLNYLNVYPLSSTSAVDQMNVIDSVMERFAYNHAPMFWIIFCTEDNASVFAKLAGDACNMTAISDEQLDEITRVCIYSELNCFN